MKERPILFSAPMVRAILEGRKTQTRRVVKPQPTPEAWTGPIHCEWYVPTKVDRHGEEYPGAQVFGFANEDEGWVCPYGVPGDRLWVRESYWQHKHIGMKYLDESIASNSLCNYRKVPGIHMRRGLSRLTLEITGVRVERVQDVSEEDAKAEGLAAIIGCAGTINAWESPAVYNGRALATDAYADLWDSINGKKHPWASNPWVWVIEFKRIEK